MRANQQAMVEILERYGDFAYPTVEGPGPTAERWLTFFTPADAAGYLQARCFDPERANALAVAGVGHEASGKWTPALIGAGNYEDTVGYKVANGDLSVEEAVRWALGASVQARAYIAGRLGEEREVRRLQSQLGALGYKPALDWTAMEVARPYRDHPREAWDAAARMRRAVCGSDLFVLLWAPDLLGALIECGMALGHGRRVIVVGAERESIFYSLPEVTMVDSVDGIAQALAVRGTA